jgi:hypothetical protein
MFRRRFAECSADSSPNVPQSIILGGGSGYTYMETTSRIYDTMVSLYPNWNTFDIGFDFVITRDLNTKYIYIFNNSIII